MKKEEFNIAIKDILDSENIENVEIPNTEFIKNLVLEPTLNELLFNNFEKYYIDEFGYDMDYFIMKVQDMLYNIHLLINHIYVNHLNSNNKEYIYDAIKSYVKDNSITIYKAVNYDDSDLEELDNFDLESNNSIDLK